MDKTCELTADFVLVISYHPSLDIFISNSRLLRTALFYNRGMKEDCPKEEHDMYMTTVYGLCSYAPPILEESYHKAKGKQ